MDPDFSYKNHKIAFVFAFLSAAVVIYQAGRFWVLFDLSYVLEHSYRMMLGSVIYKDFFIPYPPGTFLIQEFIIYSFGRTLYPQIIYCCLISFLTYLLTYRIIFFFNRDKWLNISLAFPVAVTGGYGIMSQPFYDPDSIFFILLSIWIVLYCYHKKVSSGYTVFAGVMAVIPSFFKQNTGLTYLVLLHITFVITFLFKKEEFSFKQYVLFFTGSALAFAMILICISMTSGIGNYIYSIISIPGKTRLPTPMGFVNEYLNFVVLRNTASCLLIIVVLKYFKLKNIWPGIVTIALVITPLYLIPLARWFFLHRQYFDQFITVWAVTVIICSAAVIYALMNIKEIGLFNKLFAIVILGLVNSAFLSQGYSGSTYSLWPVLTILYALLFLILSKSLFRNYNALLRVLFIINSIAIFSSLLVYAASEYHWSGLNSFDTKGEVYRSATPSLKGLSSQGDVIPNMDNFFAYIKNEIPFDDSLIIIPHEDPFYFATGRIPKFPLFMFDWTLKIYKSEEIADKIRTSGVKWMVIKTKLQAGGTENYENLAYLISLLKRQFSLYKTLPSYEIYRKPN